MKNKYASLNIKVKAVDAALFQIRAVFSTPNIDRHGEIVDQKGWDLAEFMLNPVVLWSHDSYAPAIGKVVDLAFIDGNLEGTIQFAVKEYAFAETIYNLMAGGYINAISVGFENTKWMFDEAQDVMVLLENTLYEVSVVNIPANSLALAKQKGLDVSAIEKRTDRAASFKEKLLGSEAAAAAGAGEEIEQIEKDEEEIQATAPLPGDEKKEEPVEPKAPAPEAPAAGASAEEAAKALEVLFRADKGTINAAVKALQKHLDVAKTSRQGSNVGGKKFSATQINRVVRSLINAKSQ